MIVVTVAVMALTGILAGALNMTRFVWISHNRRLLLCMPICLVGWGMLWISYSSKEITYLFGSIFMLQLQAGIGHNTLSGLCKAYPTHVSKGVGMGVGLAGFFGSLASIIMDLFDISLSFFVLGQIVPTVLLIFLIYKNSQYLV